MYIYHISYTYVNIYHTLSYVSYVILSLSYVYHTLTYNIQHILDLFEEDEHDPKVTLLGSCYFLEEKYFCYHSMSISLTMNDGYVVGRLSQYALYLFI